jgi:hypothetical protein
MEIEGNPIEMSLSGKRDSLQCYNSESKNLVLNLFLNFSSWQARWYDKSSRKIAFIQCFFLPAAD